MQLDGLLVPSVTPLDDNDRLDESALEAHLDHLIAAGAAGIILCGTTGEYYALEDREREHLLQRGREIIGDRALKIAGINDLSTRGCIQRARHAESLGYDALMMAPPAYSLPRQHEIAAHCRAVAEATRLDLILYNFPQRTGVGIATGTVAELARVDNIVGIKESSGDFGRIPELLGLENERFRLICGTDDQAADYLFWGVRSWISGSGNVFPGEQSAMIAAATDGDWQRVRSLMQAMLPVIASMEAADYNQKAKLGCRRHGVAAGPVRAPLLPLSETDAQAFLRLVEAAGES